MAERDDPYAGYNFMIEIDNITRAGFKECSGLENSQEAGTYREGTDRNLSMRKLPGLVTHSDITLSRGITKDASLWEWRQKAMEGTVERRNMSITLLDDVGNPRVQWDLAECWPTTWTGPTMDATADEVAIEQVTIAYERISKSKWT